MTITRTFALFGGNISLTLYDVEDAAGDPVIESAYSEALRLNKIFNFYDKNSELSILNKKRQMKVSKELLEVVKMALPYCELTKGAYDISLGKQILARKSGKTEIFSASYKDIIVENNAIVLNGDAMIDLGSVAKGYIGDKVLAVIKDFGVESALVDMRGDMLVYGEERAVSIKHPRQDGIIASFNAKDKGIATSGDYNQHYGSYEQSHILNSKDIISATVVAGSLAEADILATCLMVADKNLFEGKYVLIDKDLMMTDTIGCSK
jgi:FAD:protein FMN transferase